MGDFVLIVEFLVGEDFQDGGFSIDPAARRGGGGGVGHGSSPSTSDKPVTRENSPVLCVTSVSPWVENDRLLLGEKIHAAVAGRFHRGQDLA